jgi:hypothetical protein
MNRKMQAYNRLENGPIDEIDAAVFSGDMFFNESNRIDFIAMMARWERQLKTYEDIEDLE